MKDKKLLCPYDLSTPQGMFKWQIDLMKYWYIESFKLSYPILYNSYKIVKTWLNIQKLKFLNKFY